uniref:Uncharacterized protein n=1 Tax=Leersia perrieri TaxID=77586 RepID=A0A0D9XH78_9ORYZ
MENDRERYAVAVEKGDENCVCRLLPFGPVCPQFALDPFLLLPQLLIIAGKRKKREGPGWALATPAGRTDKFDKLNGTVAGVFSVFFFVVVVSTAVVEQITPTSLRIAAAATATIIIIIIKIIIVVETHA